MKRAGIVIFPKFLAAVLMSAPDAAHALGLLRAHRQPPRGRSAAEQG
jgi:hypothetical protein